MSTAAVLDGRALAEAVGSSWGKNDLAAFVALFRPDGDIIHPYFKEPISPRIAMEVMNSAVKGKTRLYRADLVSGDGSGREDDLTMLFEETGDMIGFKPKHVGLVKVRMKLRDHLVQRMFVDGIIVVDEHNGKELLKHRPVERLTAQEMAERLASTWGTNDMPSFLGLFAPGAMVKHAMLAEPASPCVVAEVMNCNVKGTTRLVSAVSVRGDGSGRDELVEMEFEETGEEVGFEPPIVGRLSILAELHDHLISALQVFGYQVTERSVKASSPLAGVDA